MIPLSKEDEKWIYTFIKEELRFMPDVNIHSPFLPFRIQRPFAVFDISSMQEGTDLMDELIIEALCNSLPIGHKLYSIDWNHSCVLYDPRNAETAQGDDEFPFFTKNGLVYFNSFFPNGDYYFFIEKYGRFGYLSHPWREEVWIFGEPLLKGFEKIYKTLGWTKKSEII